MMIKTEKYNKMQQAKQAISYLIVFVSSLVLLSCALESVDPDEGIIRRPSSSVPLTFRPVHPYANPLWNNTEGNNNNRLQFFSDEPGGTIIEIREVDPTSPDRPVPCFLNSEIELDSSGEGSIEFIPYYWKGPANTIGDRVFLEITGTSPNGEEFKLGGAFPLLPVEIIPPAEIESVTVDNNNTPDDPSDDFVRPEFIPLEFEVRGISQGQTASVTIISSYGSLSGEEDTDTQEIEVESIPDAEGNVINQISISYFPKPVLERQEIMVSFDLPLPPGTRERITASNSFNNVIPVIGCASISNSGTDISRTVYIDQRRAQPPPPTTEPAG